MPELTKSITDFATQMLQYLNVDQVQVSTTDDEEYVQLQITVEENESGILIGHHGETIASIQRIVNIGFTDALAGKRVIVNINDYKEKRESAVLAMAERYVERLKQTGEPQALPFLPANERLIVHMAYKNDPEIETFSQGEARQRKLIVQLKETSSPEEKVEE